MTREKTPVSTYRVQFSKEFRFLDCRDIVPYLHLLGIGALYSSPRFRARRGSEHGYDVASPLRVNSELGTDEEFDDLCSKLRHYGLGLVLDIVPNHMAASHENPWWMDVLENGRASPYAHYFDIDWHPVISKAAFLQDNKILLPILGDLYGNVLKRGELSLCLDETGFSLRYYERKIPLDPASYGLLLAACQERIIRDLGKSHDSVAKIMRLRQLVRVIPIHTVTGAGEIGQRLRDGQTVKQEVFSLYRDHLEVRLAMDAALRGITGNVDLMHQLLEGQPHRLAFWKVAFEEINYRRFFDINDLVCLRVEDEDVFAARHKIIFQLIAEGKVTGLRVDHVDGLHDPQGYLARLQAECCQSARDRPVFVVVEKILSRGEGLPVNWQACGTTGYDFLNALNGLFIEPGGLREIESIYSRFTGQSEPFAEICYDRNKQVIRDLFAAEVRSLGHDLGKLAAQDRQARDVPLSELISALVEVTACLPIYRTYIRDFEISSQDRATLVRTLELARRRTSDSQIGDPAFGFLEHVLMLEPPEYAKDLRSGYLRFVMRWQQFSGPVMAKGLEDTAGYVHNSLISMNEVGGDPIRDEPPLDLAGFHRFLEDRLLHWPHSMNASSTHDTKRSEDVRGRLNVLSELPGEWEKCLLRWCRLNQHHKTEVDGNAVPAPGEEVMLYQTLLGAWPMDQDEESNFLDRVQEFLKKAVREAKVHSGWIRPDQAYEDAFLRFAKAIFHKEQGSFTEDFLRFQQKVAWYGALNALSQVLIKITAPGLPDFYQGCEIWDFAMVDPDNRRPVDFRRRIRMLEEIRKAHSESHQHLLHDILSNWRDGRIKLYITDRALDFRRANTHVYEEGDYLPLDVRGEKQSSVCSFARHRGGHWCITVAPRLTTQLGTVGRPPLGEKAWRDTSLCLPAESAPQVWQNILTGERVKAEFASGGEKILRLSQIMKRFPLALLGACA